MADINSPWDAHLTHSVPERSRVADRKRTHQQWHDRIRPRDIEFRNGRVNIKSYFDGNRGKKGNALDTDPICDPEYCTGRKHY